MKRRLSIGAVVVASVVGGVAITLTIASAVWKSQTSRIVARLGAPEHSKARCFSRDDLQGLPDPVVRFFEFALTPGQPLVRDAYLRQTGEFALRRDTWSPFTATEYFSVDPPGFLWDARVRMAVLMPFFIRDGYVARAGMMYGTLAAIVPVVNEHGTADLASGELLRYLAEAVFFPTALLPRGGISWQPVDDRVARVTLSDGPTTVTCDVTFRAGGEIERVSAMRGRDANGTLILTAWIGRFHDYRRVDGMMIPMTAEVEWIMPDGPFPYWRGRIESVQYEFAS